MRHIQEALSRLVAVFRRRSLDRDFDDEVSAHLELLTARNERRGLTRDEARRQAILQMGGLNATRDLHRQARGLPPVDALLDGLQGLGRDLVHAARSLAKAKGFTVVCVASLSIGMATVIAIPYFGRVITMPPPGVDTEGLVEILMVPRGPLRAQIGDWASDRWSYPDFADLRDAETGIAMSGWTVDESKTTIQTADGARDLPVPTMYVSANYFTTVGVTLARGPGFHAAVHDRWAADPVVIVAHSFWQNRLGADPDIVGKTLALDGIQHVVMGVAPDQFSFHLSDSPGTGTQLFVPLERHPRLRADQSLRVNRDLGWVRIHARLAPGVSRSQANAAVSAVMSGLARQYRATNEFKGASVEPYFAAGAREKWEFRAIEAMLLGVTGMVLLVVCLNLSGMMQVRGAMRERELSVRQAIGATRVRLVQYLLAEAIMLAALGGALATLALFSIPPVLVWWYDLPIVPLSFQEALGPNLAVAAFAVGLCLATSVVFGLLPALRFSRPTVISALKDDAGAGGRRVGRIHRVTAALQVGIAMPFLAISATMVDQVRTTATAGLGFEPERLAAVRLQLDREDGKTDSAFRLRTAREDLARASSVASVAAADGLPLDFGSRVVRVSRPDNPDVVGGYVTRVGEGYLETLAIPLRRGRHFNAGDAAGAALVAIVSEPLAARLFGSDNAIGQRLSVAIDGNQQQTFTIVGVTADFAGPHLDSTRAQLLVPLEQHPAASVFLVARSAAGIHPAALAPAFQNAVGNLDPDFTAADLVTGDELTWRGMRDILIPSAMGAGSGGIVLTLAALGIYGVIGFMVAMRTREIAVRVALGASRRSVLRMILGDVVTLVTPGVTGGLLLAIALVRLMVALPIAAMEPVIYTLAAAVGVGVALLAGLAPARRAASVEPMVAMRSL